MAPSSSHVDPSTIKEWHFHTCFYATNERSKQEAQALRDELIRQVNTDPKNFIAVCNVNLGPVGPHLSGSFETWAPAESFAQVLSWFTLHRGSLSILVHPLTRYEREDHTTHAMWLGTPWVVDLDVLREELPAPPLQYPELGFGYSAK
ncbi:hypothetical protein BBO99_00002149 [Phytophthora kernoviae]|uniref:DOPA 4,5-dioxygenase n=2 Tax=Phytophthora kernoviae TaxID=325452 RepID=A0A3R7JXE4_9STRA|nr:hypothetical protein G195_003910 [Phytophthora kernoviae 00238/432]KAG2523725.1 hypothetical protein JM16_004959 [Phytophthora kernoviae]KAG2525532.1 hypothetical protein JM18_004892 [Phytophthora kernoviae]RLN14759.1 hypothetical protein BBI17_002003 [Phytophthora kernoviae]RLN83465.1 hypothetical protein BBO99_00002149 [Phytophthora kernoviae]